MQNESLINDSEARRAADSAPEVQIVYVLMSEGEGGVSGIVCATRERAENELRDILSEYTTYDAEGAKAVHSDEAIESFVQEMRQASINPCREDWYWIDECEVHH
jgi:hypothetical protein